MKNVNRRTALLQLCFASVASLGMTDEMFNAEKSSLSKEPFDITILREDADTATILTGLIIPNFDEQLCLKDIRRHSPEVIKYSASPEGEDYLKVEFSSEYDLYDAIVFYRKNPHLKSPDDESIC